MATLPEILIILATMVIVFGVGKLTQLGKNLGEAGKDVKKGFKEGYEGKKPLDVTPSSEKEIEDVKPGSQKQKVEDANIE